MTDRTTARATDRTTTHATVRTPGAGRATNRTTDTGRGPTA
ncbi:hypothetical protein [Streptomyces nitrosporeus]